MAENSKRNGSLGCAIFAVLAFIGCARLFTPEWIRPTGHIRPGVVIYIGQPPHVSPLGTILAIDPTHWENTRHDDGRVTRDYLPLQYRRAIDGQVVWLEAGSFETGTAYWVKADSPRADP